MEVREAGLGDLSGIVALHSRARVAYYGAGGLPVGEILTPELAREQREGWAGAITSAHKQVRCAIVDGALAGVLAMGPPGPRPRGLVRAHTRPDPVDLALPAPGLPVLPRSPGHQLQDRRALTSPGLAPC
ncbi:hypothetical protein [Micromonospora sp. C28ISP2-4]|uniref:hypothetical protein n=1 Tax=Micromonospora sp. C28ISP2-4 TaxID=3059523 RepID=UPI0026751A7A|nr:hypothetical protein [Micromonospora sp. C28ISP2-4]MDO3682322.1 hypothetical protein [Micromonospora sp. C28ISP2-4]